MLTLARRTRKKGAFFGAIMERWYHLCWDDTREEGVLKGYKNDKMQGVPKIIHLSSCVFCVSHASLAVSMYVPLANAHSCPLHAAMWCGAAAASHSCGHPWPTAALRADVSKFTCVYVYKFKCLCVFKFKCLYVSKSTCLYFSKVTCLSNSCTLTSPLTCHFISTNAK